MSDETNQQDAPVTTKGKPVAKPMWIPVVIVSLYYFFGLDILYPLVVVGVILLIGYKTVHDNAKRLFLPAFSVQTWQLLLHGYTSINIGNLNPGLWEDIVAVVVLTTGLTWLILKPGLGPLILLGIVQTIKVIAGVFSILMLTFKGPPPTFPVPEGVEKIFLLHLMISALAIALMILAYLKFRKSTNVA